LALRGGPGRDACWVIGLRDPRDEASSARHLGGVALRQGGVATSGAAWRWWQRDGQRLHHLVDPRTGRPATTAGIDPDPQALVGVTALAQTATTAEVYAKYALLLGMPTCLATLNRGLDVAGICIMGDGSIIPSTNIYSFLAAHGEQP
ncbi:MAG TPA: FAD:protein FMN transferase, partial [Ktedonobacterales bacterium]|nr:FAD:protein FMN transferase [Ktedonobacterales bacterium]